MVEDKHYWERMVHEVEKKVQHLLVAQDQMHDVLHDRPTEK